MNISQIDALLNALLASPTRTPRDLAEFIYTQYRDYCEAAARSIIAKNFPAMYNPLLIAETAADAVLGSQTAKALDGSFSFEGSSRYSTYLYSALRNQIPRVYKKSLVYVEPKLAGRVRLESAPQDSFDHEAPEREGADTVLAQAYRQALQEGLNECMAELEPREAQLATMVFLRGLSPNEACRRLGFRSPSYTWKLLQEKLQRLLARHDLSSLYAGYRELSE